MTDRYMVIHPDTLEAMHRAGHIAKLEARIEKLEAENAELGAANDKLSCDTLQLYAHIEKLEAALIDILKVPRSEASWGIALVIAHKALEGKDETIG